MNVDLMAGVRWWEIDADVKLKSQVPALNPAGDNTESWFDPLIGVRGKFLSLTPIFLSTAAPLMAVSISMQRVSMKSAPISAIDGRMKSPPWSAIASFTSTMIKTISTTTRSKLVGKSV